MKLAVIANPKKYSIKELFAQTLDWAAEEQIPLYLSKDLNKVSETEAEPPIEVVESEAEAVDRADIVVAIGGDGTILYSARLVKSKEKPVLGVNSGRLGFMANTQQENLHYALEQIRESNYRLDRRYMLQAVDGEGNTYHALNEFLFTKKDTTSMVAIDAEYDNMFINKYWADGLIVASPTGSTAYNLSSFGPIVMPNTNVMVVTPISPHTLTTRPLVLPSDKSLKVTVEEQNHEVIFSYDGEIVEIDYPFEVDIKRSDFTIDLIELPDQSYFDTLRNKLMWGMDFRERM
ncbi:MAG: NAD(+)/NADH kinase [Balneolaceae bacterium]|nr:NAD(+)/NADH kinase [Balneolaceae bacterium]